MTPSDYVNAYLNLPAFLADGSRVMVGVSQYLQNGLGTKSIRAQKAKNKLYTSLPPLLDNPSVSIPSSFSVNSFSFQQSTIERVYWGKGTPSEIQTVLYLVSICGLVDATSMQSYCDVNLGVDCGGFVASYYGLGIPSLQYSQPTYWSGIKPRTFWNTGARRKTYGSIAVGDAMVFIRKVNRDNPDVGGSEAHHIALVSQADPSMREMWINLSIAESSGAVRSDGTNGVNTRQIGTGAVALTTDSSGWVYYQSVDAPDPADRCYFVGALPGPGPLAASSTYPFDPLAQNP